MVQRSASICMEEDSKIVGPILSLCLDKIVNCVAGEERREKRNKNVKVPLTILSKNGSSY